MCQAIYREEFKQLERWVKGSRLDQLKYVRQKLTYCYFSTAAILFAPPLSEACISMTKNCVLATVVDDFFDVGSSIEEQQNILKLSEKWEGHLDSVSIGYCNEQVEIIFSTLQNTINEFADKASAWQGRRVEHHIIEIWHDLQKSMMREAEWVREKLTPTMDEYMAIASISFAMGPIVLIPIYFLGPILSEEVVTGTGYNSLYQHISIIGRLIDDLASIKRESAQGKLNSVSLCVLHSQGVITEEEAMREMRGFIENHRRELLRKVLQTEGSVVPKACKDLFWKKAKVLHFFYKDKDGYSCPNEMVNAAKAILGEPISLPPFSS